MVSSLNQIEPAGDQDTHSELSRINILSEGGRYWAPKDEGQEQTVSTYQPTLLKLNILSHSPHLNPHTSYPYKE